MYSSNEVQSTLYKAIIGAGYKTGIAEDISKAGLWLCRNGFDGCEAVLEVLQHDVTEVNISTSEDGVLCFQDVCVLQCGPSIIEILVSQLGSNVSENKVYVKHIDSPLLLMALAARSVFENNVELTVQFSESDYVRHLPNGVRLPKGLSVELVPKLAEIEAKSETCIVLSSIVLSHIVLSSTEVTSADILQKTVQAKQAALFVVENTWLALQEYAAKTYVPATEASRLSGAGAGLTDND